MKIINEYIKSLVLNIEETNGNFNIFQKIVNLKRHLEKIYHNKENYDFDDFLRSFGSKFDE